MLVALLFRLILVWSCSVTLLLSCVAAAAAMSLPDEGENKKKKKKKKKKKFCSLCFSIFCSVLLCLAVLFVSVSVLIFVQCFAVS